jgi:carboxyl-terminal processing protease
MMSLSRARVARLCLVLGFLALGGCQTSLLPIATGALPTPVVVADASPERAALNGRVYDLAAAQVERLYYDRDMGGLDWPALVEVNRPLALAARDEAGLYRSLAGLLTELNDRHTNVTPPGVRNRRDAYIRGEATVSYGVTILRHGDLYRIEDVRPGSAAAEAGVQIGWRLISVNGVPAGVDLLASVDRDDVFVFLDEDEVERRIVIRGRDLESRPVREVTRREDGLVVLKFSEFRLEDRDWMREQVAGFQADPPRGVIIDLRSNGGGSLGVLGDMVGMYFVERPAYAVIIGRFADVRYRPVRQPHQWLGPTAVVIGPGSGSASELFAAAFQERARGPVVGQRSAGAVIASRQYNLPDGGELSVSILSILTAERKLLEKVGVTPDMVIEPSLEDRRAFRDVTLEAAAKTFGPAEPALADSPPAEASAVETPSLEPA